MPDNRISAFNPATFEQRSLDDRFGVPPGRALPYTPQELEEKADWTHRPIAAYVFQKPIEPKGAGDIPLTNAALWIASRGGEIEILDRSEKEWISAFAELFEGLLRHAPVLTTRDPQTGIDVEISASRLRGVARRYSPMILVPDNVPTDEFLNSLAEIGGERWHEAVRRRQFWDAQVKLEPGGETEFIEFTFSPSDELWNESENDKMFLANQRQPWRTHIRVKNEFVRAHWPFHPPGRP
jgi:hypothetical protein